MPGHDGIEQHIRKLTMRVTHEPQAEHFERLCTDDHYHLPLEGTSPKSSRRSWKLPSTDVRTVGQHPP